jgi:two-component system, chemotaxis family, response regulator Rcp1
VGRRVFQILYVEDDPATVRLLRCACEDRSVPRRLHHVLNAADALRFLRKQPPFEHARSPDLILLDINLPGASGLDLLAEIKAHPIWRLTPVVMLSSSARKEDIARAYSTGAACYIRKPLSFDEFSQALNASLRFWLSVATLPKRTKVKGAQA